MSDERCACGRFLALPGGMAQIEDGVYHVPSGAPACEVIALRDEVERLTRERDEWQRAAESQNQQWSAKCEEVTEATARAEAAEARAERAEREVAALKLGLSVLNKGDGNWRDRSEEYAVGVAEGAYQSETDSTRLRDALGLAVEMLAECAPLTDHNADAPPPHRLCMACGVAEALSEARAALDGEGDDRG